MSQKETEQLTRMGMSAALSRSICTVAELGVADLIESGNPQPIDRLAGETGAHEQSLYRMMHRIFPAWEGLHHAVLTGESGFQGVFHQPIFEYIGFSGRVLLSLRTKRGNPPNE